MAPVLCVPGPGDLVVVATDRLLRSRFGRAFLAIKGNEFAAAAMGIPTNRYIVLCFG